MISEAQRIERRSGIGGSDAAAVLGMSPWATPVTVWLDKTGRSAPKAETPQMRYGTYFEDYVAKLYCEEKGCKVENYRTMIHKGCLLGNLDRLVVPEGQKRASYKGEVRTDTMLECKTAGRDWGGEVPLHVNIQVMHYLGLIPQLRYADVAVLYRTSLKLEVFRVERDDEVIRVMQERLTAWWDEFVVGDKMPPPTNEDDCRLLWARSNPGKRVEATAELVDKVRRFADAKATEKAAKAMAAGLMSDICAALGDGEILVGPGGKPIVTWKSAKDAVKTDWEAVATDLGATADQIAARTVTTPGSRRFVVKEDNLPAAEATEAEAGDKDNSHEASAA